MSMYRFFVSIFILVCLKANSQSGLYLQHGSTFVINEGASVYINGDLFLEDKSFLDNKGTVTLGGNGPAHFTDLSKKAYAYGKGHFIFNSLAPQFIESLNQFEEIHINNKGLGLKSDITARKWILINGVVNTGPFFSIVSSADTQAIQAGINNTSFSQSWFNGKLKRSINTAGFNSYIFPVGNAERAYCAELDNLVINSKEAINYIDASFSEPSRTISASDREKEILFLNQPIAGIWNIIPQKEITRVSYNLRLATGKSYLPDTEYTILAEGNNSWLIPPGSIVQANSELRGFISRNHISDFTTFSIFKYSTRPKSQPIQLSVFPNPVTDYRFIIELADDDKIVSVKLFTADGKEQKLSAVSTLKENRVHISVPQGCAKGIYTLIVSTQRVTKTSKLIIL